MSFSLPSIQEMFPEHLLETPPNDPVGMSGSMSVTAQISEWSRNNRRGSVTLSPTSPSSSYLHPLSHDLLQGSKLSNLPPIHIPNGLSSNDEPKQIVGKSTSSRRRHSTSLPFQRERSSPRWSSEELSDEGEDKKHPCTICQKRFSRPSALRIHMNTHTGATPFLCPHPECGQEFNVKSNMVRHFKRSHSTSSKKRSQVKPSADISIVDSEQFDSLASKFSRKAILKRLLAELSEDSDVDDQSSLTSPSPSL